jgi:hypothetical protein
MDNLTGKDILLDMFKNTATMVHWTLKGTSLQEVSWCPDVEANSIALTVWHFSRAYDVLKVRVLEGKPPEEEQWYTRGWCRLTGYNPKGIGWGGFGNLGGYTQEEVEVVPLLSTEDLLKYFRQAYEALYETLERMDPGTLNEPAPGWPGESQTVYVCIRNFLMDSREHIGEVKAIRALWERRAGEG